MLALRVRQGQIPSTTINGNEIDIDVLSSEVGEASALKLLDYQERQAWEAHETGLSLLHIAARDDHEAIARFLINQGLDVDGRDQIGNTPLHTAAMNGSIAVTRLLLRHSSSITALSSSRRTPLHLAAAQGHTQVGRILCTSSAEIHLIDKFGRSPIYYAIMNGHTPIMALLLNKGADYMIRDSSGKTATVWADEKGYRTILILLASHEDHNRASLLPIHRTNVKGQASCGLSESRVSQMSPKPENGLLSSSWSKYERDNDVVDPVILRWE